MILVEGGNPITTPKKNPGSTRETDEREATNTIHIRRRVWESTRVALVTHALDVGASFDNQMIKKATKLRFKDGVYQLDLFAITNILSGLLQFVIKEVE